MPSETSAIVNCVLSEAISDGVQCPAHPPGALSWLNWLMPASPKYVSLANAPTATPVKIHAGIGGALGRRDSGAGALGPGEDGGGLGMNRTLRTRFFSPARMVTLSSTGGNPGVS